MPTFAYAEDTFGNWQSNNRTPGDAELCRETDTGRLRLGDGTTAWSGLDPYAPTPTPEFVNCGPDTLRQLRALFGRARSGSATPAPIVILGASVFCGVLAGGIQGAFPNMAVKSLWAAGIPAGGTGWVTAWNNTTDSRWTHGFGGLPGTYTTVIRSSTASGQAETFVSDVAGTQVQVALAGDSGPVTITVDGASQTVTGTGGTANTVNVLTYTGFANTGHTVVVTATSTTAAKLIAIRVSGSSGLELHNWSLSAAGSGTLSNTQGAFASPGKLLPALLPGTTGLVCIGSDVWWNDGGTAATVATTKASVAQAITDAQGAGHAVLLMLCHQANPAGVVTAADTVSNAAAWYSLAQTYNVPLLDMGTRWAGFATMNAAPYSYMADNNHANALGQEDWAAAFAGLLTQGYQPAPDHWDPSPVLVTPVNGFTSFGSGFYPAGYFKDRAGVVHLTGLVNIPATVPAGIFTLPAGYRPAATRGFGCIANNAAARVDVQNNGTVYYAAGPASTWLSLDNISFVPDQ